MRTFSTRFLQRFVTWRTPDLWAPVLLLILGILFFSDILFSSKNFYFRDILNFHYPLRKILIDSYSGGKWPLWNPYIYLGQPMLANPNYMAFYPSNLFHFFLPFNYVFKLHFVVHPVMAGLGAYFLQRRLGLGGVPALAGAIAYQFSGTVLSFLNLYNLIPATALIPWIGWAFWGALHGRCFPRTLLLGLLLALQIIAFEPLLFQCCVLLIAALSVVYLLDQNDRRHAFRNLVSVASGAVLLAVGLAAVQILPTLELLPLSARGRGMEYSVAAGWSMHPMDFINTVVPNFYGYLYTIGSALSWGESYHELTTSYLVSFFLGSVTVLLAVLSLFSTKSSLKRVLVTFCLLTVALALGKFAPIYPFLFRHAPFFDLGRYPSKYFILTTLLISMLAGLGLEAMLGEGAPFAGKRSVRLTLGIAVVSSCAILGLGLSWLQRPDVLEVLIRGATPTGLAAPKEFSVIASRLALSIVSTGAFLLLGAGILMVGGKLRRSAYLGVVIIFLMGAELISGNLGLSPLISDADLDYIPEITSYVNQYRSGEPFRTVTSAYLSPWPVEMQLQAPNRSSAWLILFFRRSGQGLDGIRSGLQYAIDHPVDHLNTRESDLLLQRSLGLPVARKLTVLANLNCSMVPAIGNVEDKRMVPLFPVSTHSNLDYRLYRLKGALPRAYFASNVIAASSQDDALRRFLKMEATLSDTVILESPEGGLAVSGAAGRGQVKIDHYESDRITCSATANCAGYLVLLDSWFPGWKAFVDGQEAKILRANFAFRAVAVPGGEHRVEFVFRPRSFYVGAGLTLCTLLAAGLIALGSAVKSPLHRCPISERQDDAG